MDQLNSITAFFGGTAVALAVIAYLGKNLVLNALRKDLERYTTELKHAHDLRLAEIKHENKLLLKERERRDKYRTELAIRQLDAAENLWKTLEPTSLSQGQNRIIENSYSEPTAKVKEAGEFISNFTDAFNQGAGLYISKETRVSLHKFRDYIRSEIVESNVSADTFPLSAELVQTFKYLRREARIALRRELGSADLRAAIGELGEEEI